MRKLKPFFACMCILIAISANSAPSNALPPFYNTDEDVKSVQQNKETSSEVFLIDDHPMHVVVAGESAAPAVLFIHGSPGSWDAWAQYLNDPDLKKRTYMVALDRPGYGQSNNKSPVKDLKEQAKLIMGAFKKAAPKKKTFAIVGHSYGGPLALQIAIDYPEHVSSMLLLAPAISPEIVKARWYNKLADLWGIRSVIPKGLHQSNEEMLVLREHLKGQKPYLENITAPTAIIQGEKDWIVLPANAEFAKDTLKNAPLKIALLPDQSHFLPWDEYDFVKKTLIGQLSKK